MQELLRCPVTKTALQAMTAEQLNHANRLILDHVLQHLDGTVVRKPLGHAFISADGQFAYPVEDDIALLLPAFAIALHPDRTQDLGSYRLRQEKQVVQDWYNEFGWQTGEGGRCLDSLAFGDLRPVSQEYGHKTHLRPLPYLRQGGRYILDVASGAVPQPEYLQYSQAFEKRICIDLSFVALQQAKKKLGERGIYVLGDITNLPLQDNVCDAVMSLHTIYHVPADEQSGAFRELYRVLKPGGTELVIYNWGRHSLILRIAGIPLHPVVLGAWRWFKNLFRVKPRSAASSLPNLPPRPACGLYFHAHSYRWFRRELGQYCRFDMLCWRSVDQQFLQYYIRPRLFGKALLRLIYWWEERFPHLAARLGVFPMFVIRKPALPMTPAREWSPSHSAAHPPESVRV